MDRQREQLVRRLRRRRLRLMGLCVATAVACGTAAALIVPRVIIGGQPRGGGATFLPGPDVVALGADGPLGLLVELELDPRERRASVERWARLSQAERDAYFQRYWRLAELDPDRRDELLEQYQALREQPRARQEFLRGRARELRRFIATLGPQDQAVLKGMTTDERARRLLELWKARYGTW